MNNIDLETLQKMIFIYNAILKGWTVKKIEHNKIDFKKETQHASGNLNEFIQENLKIPEDLIKQ